MQKIIKTACLNTSSLIDFDSMLSDYVNQYQNANLDVEIQFNSYRGSSYSNISALIIGREKLPDFNPRNLKASLYYTGQKVLIKITCRCHTSIGFYGEFTYLCFKILSVKGGIKMNYWKQISEMLQLEWNEETQESEEFYLVGFHPSYVCRISKKGLYTNTLNDTTIPISDSTLIINQILSGEIYIKKLPWKPKDGDKVYVVSFNTSTLWWQSYFHLNDILIRRNHERGLIFKTKEEAESAGKRILELWEEERSK